MSMNKVEEMVESYLNGNVSDFKKWLKHRATKKEVIGVITALINFSWYRQGSTEEFSEVYLHVARTVSKYLN